MCGIFYFETISKLSIAQLKHLQEQCVTSAHRGPDKTTFVNDTTRAWGFHRLSINGMDPTADQPFHLKNCRLICNGEIYNFRELIAKFGLESEYKSGSDCEIIIHLYRKIGIQDTLRRLDGVFAFVLYDYDNDKVFVARDPVGVRSLYIGVIRHESGYGAQYSDILSSSMNPDHYAMCISSEMKSMHSMCDTIAQFPAGCYMEYASSDNGAAYFYSYYEYVTINDVHKINQQDGSVGGSVGGSGCLERQIKSIQLTYSYPPMDAFMSPPGYCPDSYPGPVIAGDSDFEAVICKDLRVLFTSAVKKRLMSERPVGCLLSGGLDSSLVTAIVARELRIRHPNMTLNTYSIGLEGSVDLYWGRRVADHLGTCHHEVVLTELDFLLAIKETIEQTESYCTTTIRASVGNYLVSKYIQNSTDDVVIYCGDMSDEIFGSYRGFLKAPSDVEFQAENERMIRDVRFFDLLRSDKSISGAGLEARVPFADKAFLSYVMRIPARFKRFYDGDGGGCGGGGRIEKYLIRKAFENEGLLPSDVLWRRKEAFSDGVSSQNGRTWIQMIKEYTNSVVSDAEFNNLNNELYKLHNPPYDKESFFYRRVFETFYDGRGDTIPYYWRHPFCEKVLDPSARLLDFYVTDKIGDA